MSKGNINWFPGWRVIILHLFSWLSHVILRISLVLFLNGQLVFKMIAKKFIFIFKKLINNIVLEQLTPLRIVLNIFQWSINCKCSSLACKDLFWFSSSTDRLQCPFEMPSALSFRKQQSIYHGVFLTTVPCNYCQNLIVGTAEMATASANNHSVTTEVFFS